MELRIKGSKISVEYVGREVLGIDDLEIFDYEKIGLVGGNGAGKSTLLKVLLGEITPMEGEVKRFGEFAYIPQLDEAVMESPRDPALMGKLNVKNFEREDQEIISGGEETRLKIARAFSEQVHGIFADEPTSHLDREGIDFLIGQLKYFPGALLVVSHERHFLDEVVDKIWELEDGKITEYWGNYSDYLRQKEEEVNRQAAKYEQIMAERKRLEEAAWEKRKQAGKIEQKTKGASKKNRTESGGRLSHQKPIGSKQKKLNKAAKAMEQKIEALEDVQAPDTGISIRFEESDAVALHNPYPIIITELSKTFEEKVIFDKASLSIPLGVKAALIGKNGTGKTTLMEMIIHGEAGIEISPKARIGYFNQQSYRDQGSQTLVEFFKEESDYGFSEIRSALASMGFKENDLRKKVSVLSGGELIKLNLLKMLLGRYNILLMDEPGNYLDLPSLEALEGLMKGYGGTILFTSHDRRLVENVADVIYEIKDLKIIEVRTDVTS